MLEICLRETFIAQDYRLFRVLAEKPSIFMLALSKWKMLKEKYVKLKNVWPLNIFFIHALTIK